MNDTDHTDTSDAAPTLTSADGSPLPYADAVGELEEILRSLEAANVDVDSLATRVERATALIGYCRARLATVESNVAAVLEGGPQQPEVTDD